MSSTNHTQHYGLSQWEPEDAFLREDFNEDFRKIDGVLHSKHDLRFGSYEGDDQPTQFISLGYTPKAIFVFGSSGQMATSDTVRYEGGFAVEGMAHTHGIAISEGGITVTYNRDWRQWQNCSGIHYYMAVL